MESIWSDKTEPASSWSAWLVRLLLSAQVLAALFFVGRQLEPLWHDRWAQDDAYISFRYAKHLVEGHGLVYNIGQRVEGYTNFLWTMLSAIPLAIGAPDPLPFMHAVSLALWVASYLLLLALGIRLFREGVWIAPVALVPLTYHWSYNMWFFSAMEVPLVSFWIIAALFFFSFDPEEHPTALAWAALCGVGLAMTRADGLIPVAGLALAGLALYGRRLIRDRQWRRYLLYPALPFLVIYLPYTLWRVTYYGSFFPNTYYAKVAYLTFYTRGWEYLSGYFEMYRFAPYLAFVVVGALLARRGSTRRYLLGSLLVTASDFFYVVRVGGDFMEWRFVTPVSGVLYPAIVIGASVSAQRLLSFAVRRWRSVSSAPGLALAGWAAGLAVLTPFTLATVRGGQTARTTTGPMQETIALLRRYCDPKDLNWGEAGKLFDQVLPKNVTIATTSAGIIPFYCDRPCLDLHGLNDPQIAHTPVDPNNRGRVGHEHWLSDYNQIRARGVDIYLYWVDYPKPYPTSLITPAKPNLETVSARLPDGRYIEFLILNHSHVDMQALRRDKRLVFYGDIKMSSDKLIYALRDRFSGYDLVDLLDPENDASKTVHGFEEIYAPNAPHVHNYHPKVLTYRAPNQAISLYDVGRRISYQARWKVLNVSAQKDLVMVVRYDHTGDGIYDLEVNGHTVAEPLRLPYGPERWDEAAITIPASLLVEGTNQFLLKRSPASTADSEFYHFWFLQPATAAPAEQETGVPG
jgi:arabinofuranosyltransferase